MGWNSPLWIASLPNQTICAMGAMATPSPLQLGPDVLDKLHCGGVISVDTDGVGLDGDLFASDGGHLALGDHADGAGDGLVLVVDHRARLARGTREPSA